ncbi:MAG: sensor domain-containing diguanylate cyclase [Solirubrobacterales bacterium]
MPERVLADLTVTVDELRAAALELMPGTSVFVFDHDLRLRLADGGAMRVNGYDPEQLTGSLLQDAVPESAYVKLEPEYRATLEGESRDFLYLSDDETRWYRVQTKPIRSDGEVVGGIVFTVDVSDMEQTRSDLKQANEQFKVAFDKAPIGMALVDLDGSWLKVNSALCKITGYSVEDFQGQRFADITHPNDLEEDLENASRLLAGEQTTYTMEKRYIKKDGRLVWVELNGSLVRDDQGEPLHFIAQIQDISVRKSLEDQLRQTALEDALTGLANRRSFEDQMERQYDRCRRHGEEAVLFMIDIDNLKQVNDRHGHAAGDNLLRFVAESLVRNARKHDVVARLGGDEFAMLKIVVEPDNAAKLAQKTAAILDDLSMEFGGTSISCGASVGWAALTKATDIDSAMTEADRSMYESKRRRKGL